MLNEFQKTRAFLIYYNFNETLILFKLFSLTKSRDIIIFPINLIVCKGKNTNKYHETSKYKYFVFVEIFLQIYITSGCVELVFLVKLSSNSELVYADVLWKF